MDLDEANISHEGTLAALRQKHNNSMAELGNQIDAINKNKAQSEKDKAGMERDLQESRTGLEEAMRDRANVEKNCKMAQGLIVESNTKMDELARALNDADSSRKKLQVESQDLSRQIEETGACVRGVQCYCHAFFLVFFPTHPQQINLQKNYSFLTSPNNCCFYHLNTFGFYLI